MMRFPYRSVGNWFDRIFRNALNDNFKDIENDLKDTDDKINTKEQESIDRDNQIDDRVSNIIAQSGTSDTETVDARLGADGTEYAVLKERLDAEKEETATQLAQNTHQTASVSASVRQGYYDGALVSFAFDDGRLTDYTKFKPIFESEGVPGCCCLETGHVGTDGYMTWEQAKELKSLGWTVASHTHTHIDVDIATETDIEYEYRESSRLLKEHGLDHDIIVYPYGHINDTAMKYARRYFKMGVNIVRTYLSNEVPHIDNYNLVRIPGLSQLNGTVEPTLAECKAMVDDAIANKKWIIFEDHANYPIWDSAKLEEFRQLIQYIKSLGVPIVNLQDAFNMRCNIIDVKKENNFYKLFRNGEETKGGWQNRIIDNTTPINDYPYGTTQVFMNNSQISGKGFPTGRGGTLITTRLSAPFSEDLASYQMFLEYESNEIWLRRWFSTNAWGTWEMVSYPIVKADNNAYSASSSIALFPSYSITVNRFDSNGSTGMPCSAGILITYNIGVAGYNRQEVREHNGDNVWVRYFTTSSAKSEWVLLNPYKVYSTLNKYSATTPLSTFPSDSVTTFHVDGSGGVGMPNDSAGTVTTYKIGNQPAYSRQEFRPYNSNELWSRNADTSGNWTTWVKISAV